MSFQNISLPENVIASLYADSLVLVGPPPMATGSGHLPVAPEMIEAGKYAVTAAPYTAASLASGEDAAAITKKWYLGDNRKGLVILIKDEKAVFLPDAELQLLSQILGACSLNVGDAAIINLAHTHKTYTDIHAELSGKYYFLFGMDPTEFGLPVRFPHFQIQQYNSSCFLISPRLSEMLDDTNEAKVKKSKLWLCLKQVFNV